MNTTGISYAITVGNIFDGYRNDTGKQEFIEEQEAGI
jgi:hypothetical protein